MSDPMVQVLVRLPAEMYEAVKAEAEAEDRSVAATVRRAVRQYLERGGTDG